jgi:RNA recognition motif-containing protein
MAVKLYVGNLSYTTMEENLRSLFEQSGTVATCELVLDKFTGKSRGFAFVEMASQEEADQAVEKFNDYEFESRKLVVNVARPREARPGGFGGFGGKPSGGGQGGKRKSGKGSRRGARSAKRDNKACW